MIQTQYEKQCNASVGEENFNGCSDGVDDFDFFLNEQFKRTHIYIDNDNFSALLLEKLPAQKNLTRWQEQLIVIVPLVVVSMLVLSQFSWAALAIKCWVWLGLVNVVAVFQWSISAFVLILLGVSYWLCKQYRFI